MRHFLIVLILIGLAGTGCAGQAPVAEAGRITITGLDGPLPLRGEWQVELGCLKRLPCDSKTTFSEVPGVLPAGTRYGVYRLNLTFDEPPETELALRINDAATSYVLWFNGKRVGSSGIVATAADYYEAEFRPQVMSVGFPSQTNVIEVEVANFKHTKTGLWEDVIIGDRTEMENHFVRDLILQGLVIGATLGVAVYHFVFFLFNLKNYASLVFALACGVFAVRLSTIDGRLLVQYFDGLNLDFLVHLEYLATFALVPLLTWYYSFVFPARRNTMLAYGAAVYFGILSLVALVLPISVFTKVVPAVLLGILVTAVMSSVDLVFKRLKVKDSLLVLIGIVCLASSASIDSLADSQAIVFPRVSHFGFLILILSQSTLLSFRFSSDSKATRELSADLTEVNRAFRNLNENLEQTVIQRTAQMEIARLEAEKANQAKSSFLASMSHEIRTPLHIILGISDLLREENQSDQSKEYIHTLEKAGKTLQVLINDILDLSKIEAEEMQIEKQVFDFYERIQSTFQMLTGSTGGKDVKFILDFDSNLPKRVLGDANRIDQILVNLISNAIKFTERGSITLKVRAGTPKDSVVFSIIDTGIGIDADKQQTIFEAFHQADTSTTRIYGGTGLGLAISQSLVQLMGGYMSLESEAGKGSTFAFTIPLPETNVTQSTINEKLEKWPLEAPVKVLLVEDNLDNQMIFEAFLAPTTAEIAVAVDGLEAVKLFKSFAPNIVFMDIQIPKIDGLEATEQIRAWEKENEKQPVPVIALSANATSEDRIKSFQAGCDSHLAKPLAKDRLWKSILYYIQDEPFLKQN